MTFDRFTPHPAFGRWLDRKWDSPHWREGQREPVGPATHLAPPRRGGCGPSERRQVPRTTIPSQASACPSPQGFTWSHDRCSAAPRTRSSPRVHSRRAAKQRRGHTRDGNQLRHERSKQQVMPGRRVPRRRVEEVDNVEGTCVPATSEVSPITSREVPTPHRRPAKDRDCVDAELAHVAPDS